MGSVTRQEAIYKESQQSCGCAWPAAQDTHSHSSPPLACEKKNTEITCTAGPRQKKINKKSAARNHVRERGVEREGGERGGGGGEKWRDKQTHTDRHRETKRE